MRLLVQIDLRILSPNLISLWNNLPLKAQSCTNPVSIQDHNYTSSLFVTVAYSECTLVLADTICVSLHIAQTFILKKKFCHL